MSKYRGMARFTFEKLHEILGLPKEASIMDISVDSQREIANIKISSEEEVPYLTYITGESMTILNTDIEKYKAHVKEDERNKIRVIATEDLTFYNYDMTECIAKVEADEMLEAELHEETLEYFAKDKKGREVFVGDLDMYDNLMLNAWFTLVKED